MSHSFIQAWNFPFSRGTPYTLWVPTLSKANLKSYPRPLPHYSLSQPNWCMQVLIKHFKMKVLHCVQ